MSGWEEWSGRVGHYVISGIKFKITSDVCAIISFFAINFGAIYRTRKSSYCDSPYLCIGKAKCCNRDLVTGLAL